MLRAVCGACKAQGPFRGTVGHPVASLPLGWSCVEWAQPMPEEPAPPDVGAMTASMMGSMLGDINPAAAHQMQQGARAMQLISETARRRHMSQMAEVHQMYLCDKCTRKIPAGESEIVTRAMLPPEGESDGTPITGVIAPVVG